MDTPKVFVSYSWTTPEFEQWVLDVATELRENGVDVVLDKWDLKEGQDAHNHPKFVLTSKAYERFK